MSLTEWTAVLWVRQEPQATARPDAWQTASLLLLCNTLITSWLSFAFPLLHLPTISLLFLVSVTGGAAQPDMHSVVI